MQNKEEHKLVNWVEGMSVGVEHLQQLEDYFIDRLCDNQLTRLTSYNYGLLPATGRQGNSSEFDISEQVTGRVEIRLRRCNAITSSGCRISFNPGQSDYLLYTHSFDKEKDKESTTTQFWDVILSVDPFKRIPTGIPDIEETPPRHPCVIECCRLSMAPQGKIDHEQPELHHLVIGRVRRQDGRYEVDTNYIPPCTSMGSHSDLLDYYERFGTYLNDIERASKVIIGKVRNRTQNSPVAVHIAEVCEDMMRYIASVFYAYRNMGREMTPAEITGYFSTLAHTCYISLNFIDKTEKEELLKYFYEWSDVTPGSFEELLANTLGIIYEHNSIRSVMLQTESFLHVLSELWIKLGSLEYIGQHKENIVVSERSNQVEISKTRGGWTILD
jgi:hypothetical protein